MPFKRRLKDKYAGSSRERICCRNSVRLVNLLDASMLFRLSVCPCVRRSISFLGKRRSEHEEILPVY